MASRRQRHPAPSFDFRAYIIIHITYKYIQWYKYIFHANRYLSLKNIWMPISKRCSAAAENHIQCEGEIPYLLMIYNDGFQSVFVNDHACSVQTLTHTHTQTTTVDYNQYIWLFSSHVQVSFLLGGVIRHTLTNFEINTFSAERIWSIRYLRENIMENIWTAKAEVWLPGTKVIGEDLRKFEPLSCKMVIDGWLLFS